MAEDNIKGVPKQKVTQMREWLNSQPHLPKDVGDTLLARFVHSCYGDLEKAQTAADLFFTIRGSSPELLNNRDPCSPVMKKAFGILNLAQQTVSGNRQIWIWQLNDPGLENFDYLQDARCFMLTTDAWLLDDQDFSDADIIIMDVKDISLRFLTKFNVSIAKKLSKYQEDAMPIRLTQIHIVNAPPFIDKLYALMKPFLKQELTQMIYFHTPKSDTLYKYLDKADLPSDYGGSLPSMEELNKESMALIMKHRERIINEENLWKAETKKSKSKKGSTSETSSSFRNLAID